MLLMGFWTVRRVCCEPATLMTTRMQSHPLTVVEYLHDTKAQSHINRLVGQFIRYTVAVPVNLNVVIYVRFGRPPLAHFGA